MLQTEPEVLQVERLVDAVHLSLRVPADLYWFEGHFPGVPLLPGVVQTTWAINYGRRYFDLPPLFQRMTNMKFMRFILPDNLLQLRLSHMPAAGELMFEYRCDARVCASGRIGFAVEQRA